MHTPFRRFVLPLLVLAAALPAQARKPDQGSKDGKPAGAAAKPPKEDALTAKDPAIVAIDKFIATRKPDRKNASWRTQLAAPPLLKFTADRDYLWHWQTNKGEMTFRFVTEAAPMHVTSAIYLTRLGFYDGLGFHRVIAGFMAQGGCPNGRGDGGPGYLIDGECKDEWNHDKPGRLSTANTGAPKTDGSQFFVTFGKAEHLDGKHTVFGELVAGETTLQALEAAAGVDGSEQPKERLAIERAWITVEKQGAPVPGKGPTEPAGKEGGSETGSETGRAPGKDGTGADRARPEGADAKPAKAPAEATSAAHPARFSAPLPCPKSPAGSDSPSVPTSAGRWPSSRSSRTASSG
jgi:cyclophilin family peptidyl-prolyl cis-trans isomerase